MLMTCTVLILIIVEVCVCVCAVSRNEFSDSVCHYTV